LLNPPDQRKPFRGLRVVLVLALAVAQISLGVMAVSGQVPGEADMAILGVDDSPDPVFENQMVAYQIGVANFGPTGASGIRLTTALPTGTRFEPAESSSNCSESGGTVTCTAATWDANAAGTVRVAVTPTSPGILEMTFHVSANEPDPDPSNNSETETTQVVEATDADLSISLSDGFEVHAGQPFFFAVSVFNGGPADATGIVVTLRYPPGLRPVEGERGSCTESGGGTTTCVIAWGSLPSRAGSTDLFQLRADAAGTYTVVGSVDGDQPDPNLSNNTDTGTVTVSPAADLSVVITESADPATPGQRLSYTVEVTNSGPSPATAVDLTDGWSTTVPGGVLLLSFSVSQGTCSRAGEATLSCQLGGMPTGGTATLTVVLRPRGTGTVTNTASVTGAEFDGDTSNNLDTEDTTIGRG
jgi:uncharacterized repeat protein (TIGR01451 family)